MTTIQLIKIQCIQKGITLRDLARQSGLHPNSLYQGKEPRRETLKAIAAVLDVDWRTLLGD